MGSSSAVEYAKKGMLAAAGRDHCPEGGESLEMHCRLGPIIGPGRPER